VWEHRWDKCGTSVGIKCWIGGTSIGTKCWIGRTSMGIEVGIGRTNVGIRGWDRWDKYRNKMLDR